MSSLETTDFLDAVKTVLATANTELPELTTDNITVWHHGESNPAEAIENNVRKARGVAVLIYDQGGKTNDDVIEAAAVVELYVSTTRRDLARKGGVIRDAIMRKLHRNPSLRNNAAYHDCRVEGYQPLEDPEFAAWRITLLRNIYLDP